MSWSIEPLLQGYGSKASPSPRPPTKRVIHIKLDEASTDFQKLAIYEGMSQEDIYQCIHSAAKLGEHAGFDLYDSEDGDLVPVSAALPDGIRLILKRDEVAEQAPPPPPPKPVEEQRMPVEVLPEKHTSLAHRSQSQKFSDMVENTRATKAFGKISNYLANDRTLLAWIRTSLAISGKLTSVLSLSLAFHWEHVLLDVLLYGMAFLVMFFLYVGWQRFVSVRKTLDGDSTSPDYFVARIGHHWLSPHNVCPAFAALVLAVALLCSTMVAKDYEKD